MSAEDTGTQDEERLAREAARIFLHLDANPDDPAALAQRDAFLAKGDAARRIFERSARVWGTTRRHGRRKNWRGVTLLLVSLIAGYAAYGPARIALLADVQSSDQPAAVTLASGDVATLDASSAIIDATDSGERRITLLEGAAFFEVSPNARAFRVQAGAIEALVLGTAFEVGMIGGSLAVAVTEGQVEVRIIDDTWRLDAGQRLTVQDDGAINIADADLRGIASWRASRLLTDGMTFAEVAAIIDRRLTGRIIILDGALGQTRVSGAIELTDPLLALKTLAAVSGAEVVATTPLITLVQRAD